MDHMDLTLSRPVALVGLKAVGKSTTARYLSDALDLPLIDLDERIVSIFRSETYSSPAMIRTARDVYLRTGAEGLKRLERAALSEITDHDLHILSTGGGIAENRDAISLVYEKWVTVLLSGDLRRQFERIIQHGLPPFLDPHSPWISFKKLSEHRLAVYRTMTHIEVDTRDLSIKEIALEVLNKLEERGYAR